MGNTQPPFGIKKIQSSQASTFYDYIPENRVEHEVIRFIETEHSYWKDILQFLKTTKTDVDIAFIHESLENTATKIFKYLEQAASKSKVKRPHDEVESVMKFRSEQDIQELHHKVADLEIKIKSLQSDRDDLLHRLSSLQSERDDLLLRLSKVVGDKLVQDNPNISDLSDKNRPTKLGEMYAELYDNEWTDAIEGLQDAGHDEKEAVHTLCLTLQKTFEFCDDKAIQMLDSTANAANVLFLEAEQAQGEMKQRFTIAVAPKNISSEQSGQLQHWVEKLQLQNRWTPNATSNTGQTKPSVPEEKLPLNFEAEYKHLRKELSVAIVPALQKAFLNIYWDDSCIPAMKPFVKKCLFLCWMMVVQGPPLCFDWSTKHGSKFDSSLYKQYTKSGNTVDYVVWPTMFLHEGGPMIVKGVAQPITGISDEESKHT
ncbi:uncharacterized protein LOC127878909 [Dreissena polymorpha]|uniref:Mitochondria-eating protein n=1 Tax=Dreissena polymorpha TaxID=45954 RepID=A0A9D4MPD9_DREPO|nr:uncharacterized protein LOC127878909 [Dreissena polymorpha]KAH3881000.1 hypothetical protein DPMN_004923 [Dreissena polymorpha]